MTLTDLPAGAVLAGRYRVERPLASGGTSRIYLGNPLRGAGTVAIKQLVLAGDAEERAEAYLHFRREFELLAAMTHPSLPMALDFFEEGGRWYLVEEFVPGQSLEERLDRLGRLSCDAALAVALPLLDVLAYLHARGVVYRDLKPSNVLLTHREVVRLIDFGAARHWRKGATRDTVPLGTPGYAPPEQYGTAQTDARSDVYSVGALLHQMLTGLDPTRERPWVFRPPHQLQGDVPRRVSDAVVRALQLNPADRFQSALAMREALTGDEAEAPARTVGVPLVGSPLRKLRRRYQYLRPADYRMGATVLRRVGLAGALALAVEALCWIHGLPGLGSLATGGWGASVLGIQYRLWSRYHQFVVETFDEGIRARHAARSSVAATGLWKEFEWGEIRQVRVVLPERGSAPLSADIATRHDSVTLPGEWPGTREVVDEVVAAAGLVASPADWDQYSLVGTRALTYTAAP